MNENSYIKYLTLKKMFDKINKSNKSPIELENLIYSKNNKELNEKEKVYYEINRVFSKILEFANSDYLSIEVKTLKSNFLFVLENLLEIENTKSNNYTDIKKKILELEILLNMKSGLYSIVPLMLEDMDSKERIKK